MKIACEACGAKYTIADDKVRGRKVKIRCKGCGTPIVVDGQHGGGPSISDAETDAALEPAEATVIWSVNLSDTDSRTMSVEEIVEGYTSGLVTSDAFVWKDGMADWVPLLESELAPMLGSAPAAAAPVAAAPAGFPAAAAPTATPLPGGVPLFGSPKPAAQASRPAATTRASQPDNTQDLFGSLGTAGADEDVATSAPVIPQAGSTAYDDGKMTGARNENSVLFSLDALKAGFSPSASPNAAKPAPKAPPGKGGPGAARPQQPSNPDDPFGMGAGNGLMGIGGTTGVLFGADNQALLTAPAPPPPPPAPTPAQIAAGAVPLPARANNKLVYIVGGVGGAVIIILLLILLLGKKHEDTTATAEGAASASASAAPVAVAEKPAEAPKPEEPKPSEAPSASAAASASAAPEKPADKPVAVAQTSGGTTTKKPEPTPAPAGDAPPFSKASAISALGAAASSAGSCKKPGGPTGAGKATVTFAPSGRVTTATVAGGSYAGTAVGGCVASVFRRAHVPAFSGSSVTVSKSFQIN
ncbi:MAG: zinc-ribbon domain-containing protein [Myxococcales bacterium]|jgi:predicted Zn finger-like uncharacterized protein